MKKKKVKRFRRLSKEDLKKIRGGVDIIGPIMKHGFGMEQETGTHFVLDVGGRRVGAGFKIKF